MDQTVTQAQGSCKPGGLAVPPRPDGSGEGSRSALERLIQQERKRQAQLPGDKPAEPTPPPPATP
jgi:hypothetical protein